MGHHETNADFYLATPMERVSCTLIVIKRAVQCMAAGRDNARTNKKKTDTTFFLTKLFNVYSFTFILFEPKRSHKSVHILCSAPLNAPFSKFENRKSASFRLKMGGFELLNAPERRHVFLARLKLHKCIKWIRSFSTLTSELFYDK